MDEAFRPPRAGRERIPYRLARGGERGRRAGNVLYWQRRALQLSGYIDLSSERCLVAVFNTVFASLAAFSMRARGLSVEIGGSTSFAGDFEGNAPYGRSSARVEMLLRIL